MNLRISGILLLLVSITAAAKETVKISIPDLLRPETRMRALQQFFLKSDPNTAKEDGWSDLKAFGESHQKLVVLKEQSSGGKPQYLVTWDFMSHGDEWNENKTAAGKVSQPTGGILVPQASGFYEVFDEDGKPHFDREVLYVNSIIANFRRAGDPEILAEHAESTNGQEFDYLTVSPLGLSASPSFGIVYNTHPTDQALGNTWSFQALGPDENGLFEIQLGPVLVPSGVEPKVTFHWDSAHGSWVGPKSKPGDRFRALDGKDIVKEAAEIASNGGLEYPLVAGPGLTPLPEITKFIWGDAEKLPADRLSKEYHYRTLANLSHKELYAYMSAGRYAGNYGTEEMRKLTETPDFWKLDARSAAIAYISHNRPSPVNARQLLGIPGHPKVEPPVEGDLTLSDAPSGCFAPSGTYLHHLHCAVKGSFLFQAEDYRFWPYTSPLAAHLSFKFRKLEISYEDARQILQTAWCMSKVRGRNLTQDNANDFPIGGSTSDGFATVRITSDAGDATVGAMRCGGVFMGVGSSSDGGYDSSAFIDLIVQLFEREIPEHFGERWSAAILTNGWRANGTEPVPGYTPEDLLRFKAATTEMLDLFRKKKLSPEAAKESVEAVGEMGWEDLRSEIAELTAVLPTLTKSERRLAAIESETKLLRQKMEPTETSSQAHSERQTRRAGPQRIGNPLFAIPGVEKALAPAAKPEFSNPKPLTPEEKRKFNRFDSLIDEKERLRVGMPNAESDIMDLRAEIALTLRKLDSRDDAEALFQWGKEEEFSSSFILTHLAVLDPNRCIQLLRRTEKLADDIWYRPYANARTKLEGKKPEIRGADGQPIERTDPEALLAVVRSEATAPVDFEQALEALVPKDNPQRFQNPEIESALLEVIGRPKGNPYLDKIEVALAQRMGGKAWDPLIRHGTNANGDFVLGYILPALAIIAQKEPDPYRARLGELLAPEFHETFGDLNTTLLTVWQLGLKKLKQDVEKIATSGPEDYEGTRGRGSSNHKSLVNQRYHLARQIAALWNEEDPSTRARLLIAFGLANAVHFAATENGALEHLQSELAATLSALKPEEAAVVADFVTWCEAHGAADEESSPLRENFHHVLEQIRKTLGTGKQAAMN